MSKNLTAPSAGVLDVSDDMNLRRHLPQTLGCSLAPAVVYIIHEPDRQGFAYGTLPGHPESGDEALMSERPRAVGRVAGGRPVR